MAKWPELTVDDDEFYNTAVSTIFNTYSVLEYQPHGSAWTILASFFLSRKPNVSLGTSGEIKVISLATGTKCLPTSRLSDRGELVHDSHAEVLARRSALRWFMEEILRVSSDSSFQSAWITKTSDGKYALQVGVEVNLYVSTVPCGDASTRFLASSQGEEMAALKDAYAPAIPISDLDHDGSVAASRGRDNYALLGVLRTKPGRADSPSTSCMSCSDKIARWNVLGIQGALGSKLLEPLYLAVVLIGEVPLELRETVREDSDRAFWARLGDINGLPNGFALHKPAIHFTDLKFAHSRSVLGLASSCVESLLWISDTGTHQVLINGMKRGVAPKHRYREKSRSLICRLSLMQLCSKVLSKVHTDTSFSSKISYTEMKRNSKEYQIAKDLVVRGPLFGWVLTASNFQNFTLDDRISNDVQ